jgi:hypothetical protein
VNGIAVPFLVADAVLLWMLRDAVRGRGMLTLSASDRTAWRVTLARLAILLALSLVGTVAALRA